MSTEDTSIHYGLHIDLLFLPIYYNLSDDNATIESIFETLNNTHTSFLYSYLLILLIITTSIQLFRRRYVIHAQLRHRVSPILPWGRPLRRWFLKPGFWGLPTRGHGVIVVVYLLINLWVCAWSSRPQLQLIQLARKTGWFSVVNFTLVILTAMKNSPVSWLTGYSYEKLNIFHRWIAVTALVEGIVHTIAISVGVSRLIPSQVSLLLEPANQWGIIALALFLILISAFYLLKHIRYEVFYFSHLLLFPLLFLATLLHNPYSYGPLFAGLGLYVIDRAVRWNRMYFYNRSTSSMVGLTATVKLTDDGMVVVKIPALGMVGGWRPGSHVFLCLPEVRRWESHPFSVCSVSDGVGGEMEFIIKPEDGFTKDLAIAVRKRLSFHSVAKEKGGGGRVREFKAIVDGPYGSMPDFNSFDRLLLFASGSGITFTLPIALAAVRSGRVKEVEFVWSTRKSMSYENIRRALEELVNAGARVRLFETRPEGRRLGMGGRMMRGMGMGMKGMKGAMGMAKVVEPARAAGVGHWRGYSGDAVPAEGTGSGYGAIGKPKAGDYRVFEDDYTPSSSIRESPPLATFSDDDPDPDDVTTYRTSHSRLVDTLTDNRSERNIRPYQTRFRSQSRYPSKPPSYASSSEDTDTPSSSDEDSDSQTKPRIQGPHKDVRDALAEFIFEGRPNLEEIIHDFVDARDKGETCAIAACGPGSMDVRRVVAGYKERWWKRLGRERSNKDEGMEMMDTRKGNGVIQKNGPSVSLFVEEFGW